MNDCNGCVLLFYSQCGSLITSTVLQNLSILVESASKSCCKKHHCELLTAQSCVRPFLSSTICAQKPPLETSMNQLSRTATSLATMSPAWNKILLPIHGCYYLQHCNESHVEWRSSLYYASLFVYNSWHFLTHCAILSMAVVLRGMRLSDIIQINSLKILVFLYLGLINIFTCFFALYS